MKRKRYLSQVLRSNKTVFSFKDLLLLWGESKSSTVRARIHYYLKRGDLYAIRKGLYSKSKKYDPEEAATKIFKPSYVSFETILVKAGVIFQYYEKITLASYLNREVVADEQTYSYKKIKTVILLSEKGIIHDGNRSYASPERALLDTLYIHREYHFDNLDPLDWDKVFEILPIYENKRLSKQVHTLFQFHKDSF